MRKFLINITLISLIFFALDKVFIIVEKKSPELEYDRRLEYILQGKIQKEIIIIGSSRSSKGIIAENIEKALGRTCYNFSYNGSDIDFHHYLLETYLEHHQSPKLVILGVDDYKMFFSNTNKFRADRLYPLTSYPGVTEELVIRKHKIKYFADLFVSHRIKRKSLFLMRELPTQHSTMNMNGDMLDYEPRAGFEKSNDPFPTESADYDQDKERENLVNKYLQFVDICNSNSIALLIVPMPNFKPPTPGFRLRIESLTGDNAKIFYYNEADERYKDRASFSDAEHLRKKGAEILTAEIINYIRSTFPEIENNK